MIERLEERQIKKFYTEIFNCYSKKCGGIDLETNPSMGIFPRGFSPNLEGNTSILVVAKNPGNIFKEEREIYRKFAGSPWEAKKEYGKNQIKILLNNKSSRKFHINRFRYLKFITGAHTYLKSFNEAKKIFLGLDKIPEIEGVSNTNLFKCSTKVEQQKFSEKNFLTCFNKFFKREIEILKPKILLALGNEVQKFLKKMQAKKVISEDIEILKIKHPSYFYKKKSELQELAAIKKRIQEVLTSL